MSKKQYFSTGEFAKIANISKQTLIFYDNMGIFTPEYKDEKNYRYYSINQLEALDIIVNLRDIGVSLEEISIFLKKRTPEESIKLLVKEKEEIEKKISKLQNINLKLENRMKIIRKGIETEDNLEPYIEEQEEEFLILNKVDSDDLFVISLSICKFINEYTSEGLFDNGNSISVTISKENIKSKMFTKISALYINVDHKINHKNFRVKKKGIYASINHKGAYEESYRAYEKLLRFIDDNGYEIIGDSYEKCLFDYFTSKKESDYLTKISIPIKKR